MKCPACGKELKENMLFCENCGEELRMVPEFEAEVENDMEQQLNGLKDIFEPGEADKGKFVLSKKQWMYLISGILGIILFIGMLLFGISLLFETNQNAEQLIQSARAEYQAGDLEAATKDYLAALEKDEGRVDAKLELVEIYFAKNQKSLYEDMLYSLIKDPNLMEGDLVSCYGKLIALYNTENDVAKIQALLLACESETVRTAYEEYFAPDPVFELEGGYYTKVIPLRITGNKQGAIYYTLDGSEPSENTLKYMTPIVLEEGNHVVKAIYISKSGLRSQIKTAEYHIDLTQPEPPVVTTVSGTYYEPTLIEVEIQDADIFYTDDGSVPDSTSKFYTGPIEMPPGKSVFRFASVKGDAVSDYVERTFELKVVVNYSVDDARKFLLDRMIGLGKILNYYGESVANDGYYEYPYLTSCYIREKMYYVYNENRVLSDASEATGSFYGVDTEDGTVVVLTKENNISYTITEIMNP